MKHSFTARERRLASYLGCLFAISLICFSGCQLAPKSSSMVWPWKKEKASITPDRILPVWTDSILHQTNQPGVRGFGGRIYFYGKEGTDPVTVDGSLAVYVFDADDMAPSDQKPLRKYIFSADQFQSHMSKTSIGPSYSVWLPWGEVGGPPKRLSIIARYEGRSGGTTISDPTIKMLPGIPTNTEPGESSPSDATSVASKSNKSPFNLASHSKLANQASTKDKEPEVESNVDTIELPPSFQRHLRNTPVNDISKPLPSDTNAKPLSKETTSTDVSTDEEIASNDSGTSSSAPQPTTRVYDYRTRGRQRDSFSNRLTKTDIREGKWIQSISRSNKRP